MLPSSLLTLTSSSLSSSSRILSRSVHSKRQLKRLFPGPAAHRVAKKTPAPPPTQADLNVASLRAALSEEFSSWTIPTQVPLTRLSNGFVLPPPSPLSPTSSPNSPPFRISRTSKAKGLGFYPVYLTYTSNRVSTTITVSGDVLTFISLLDTSIISPSPSPSDAGCNTPDWLESVAPTGKNCGVTGAAAYKVRVKGRWKREVEDACWAMGM